MLKLNNEIVFIFSLFTLSFFPGTISDYKTKTSNNYGEYTVEWKNFSLCRGPKAKNLTEVSLEFKKHNDNSFVLTLNVTFLMDVHIYEVKLSVFSLRGTKKLPLLNYKATEPCRNLFMFAQVATRELGVSNCRVKKGLLSMHYNFTQLATLFFGNSFYYGKHSVRTLVTAKNGNIVCLEHISIFKKKTGT